LVQVVPASVVRRTVAPAGPETAEFPATAQPVVALAKQRSLRIGVPAGTDSTFQVVPPSVVASRKPPFPELEIEPPDAQPSVGLGKDTAVRTKPGPASAACVPRVEGCRAAKAAVAQAVTRRAPNHLPRRASVDISKIHGSHTLRPRQGAICPVTSGTCRA